MMILVHAMDVKISGWKSKEMSAQIAATMEVEAPGID